MTIRAGWHWHCCASDPRGGTRGTATIARSGVSVPPGQSHLVIPDGGAALNLVREPDNAYDPRAVRVDWQGQKLGYVPRTDNAAVSHLLDTGHRLDAEIVTLRNVGNPWDRIEFVIFLADQR